MPKPKEYNRFNVPAPDIRAFRAEHRLTRRQLAEILHTSIWTVANWEQGVARPPNCLHLALCWVADNRGVVDKAKKKHPRPEGRPREPIPPPSGLWAPTPPQQAG